ncbi:hydroxyacid dehydrogenase [bacterium]|nr:hydroxyacid dehydrogenase [candidate division CSSED10-310 bacterium]
MKILLSDAFDKSLPGKLARFGEVFDDKDRLAEADVVMIRSKTKCTKEFIDAAPNLKLIIRGGVGLDNVDQAYAKEKGIAVFNTPAASSVAVAELAMAFLVAIPSKIIPGHRGMIQGQFLKKELKRTELYEKTLGLIGIGRIAREVAIRAKAFGMTVIAFDKYVSSSDVAEMVSFDDLLQRADYISIHVPYTAETDKMINAASIGKMKTGVIIVNTGRGKCINEADLAAALQSGKVAAYGTDVWYADPPDWESCPLLKKDVPNVYMTPHIGASSNENLLRIGEIIEEIMTEFTKEK